MGLFSSKKTYVSSSCYNLAGDVALRPNYLKTMVVAGVINSSPRSSIADAIRDGYMNGPGIKLRGFYRWAEDHYNSVIGLSSAGLAGAPDIDPGVVASAIGGSVTIQLVRSNVADYEVWAEQYIAANYPTELNSSWTADYNDATGQIVLDLPIAGTVAFTPSGFDKAGFYIYAAYNTFSVGGTGPVVTGPVVTLGAGDSFPSTTGWTALGGGVFEKTDYLGTQPDGSVISRKYTMTQTGTGVPGDTYQVNYQNVNVMDWSDLQVFIYKVGSGNAALDAEVSGGISVGGFFPPIPVRVDNQFVSESFLPDQYAAAQKAYKRLTAGAKFDTLVDMLADNEDLGDIDYVFVVPGVSLNVVENSCRKYLYQFFHGAMLTATYGEASYGVWSGGLGDADGSMSDWQAWLAAQGVVGDPLNGTPEPTRQAFGSAPRNEIRVRATNASLGYDTRIAWQAIKEDTGSGLGKPGATVGELWLEKGGTTYEGGSLFPSSDNVSQDLLIWWQTGASTWKRLTVRGLVHQNFIYKGKFVEIKAHEALDDVDESGFIVPIHYDTWKAMSIKDTTQMATASIMLVLNSYKVVKKKWYQTGFFKLVVFIVIVVAAVILTGPAGLATAPGLLGTAAGVGAALGLSGLVGLIVGALANAIAAAIVAKLLTVASTAVFGDKLGIIIGMIASFAALSIGAGLSGGLTITQAVTQMMNPMTLLGLTSAVGNGISGYIQADIQGVATKTQDVLKDYEEQTKSINALYQQNIGYGNGVIDPTMLLDSNQWFVEPGETFLARTLMTGSEIAELSNTLLSSFSDLTLSTELPL